ncbi:Flp pilus assembly protein CpaB [Sphingomonas sp. CGMCC 1.13654]|uniref:Flp pilus assembly protein CpaB n=1 Tax=Sphingomonas chungangi TaxID=2683589 RepID=A0A838L6U7_9SPHN|nr:Flp pilus assembly protein CpaB [Sphingomonas chungangi]MBA2935051.1 Flp pilus assembly protein CpaB [Sphingomonas chungangi]MVW54167.1 Flp pilus assembly protein CpaB [Sphingomonas chungangi]
MDGKKIALLVGALFVAAVTAIMAKNMFGTAAAPQAVAAMAPQPTGPQVLVATKPLPVGTILGPDSVRFQPWPKDLVDGAYYVKGNEGADPEKLIGTVVRSEVTAGQPVTQGSLVSPQDRGFLAAALTPGMRAVTVSVGGASGVAGFVFPGDRVDLVLTTDVNVNATASTAASSPIQVQVKDDRPLQTSETIMRNVRVLATDQRYDNQPTPEGKTQVSNFSLVTLETTPKMAEKIAVAQKLGSLSLSLRPLADTTTDLEKAIAAGDINVPAGTDPKAEKKMVLDVASEPQDSSTTFTTGAEVSRFARGAGRGGNMFAQNGGRSAPAAMLAPAAPPVIHVARGNAVTDTPVGGK